MAGTAVLKKELRNGKRVFTWTLTSDGSGNVSGEEASPEVMGTVVSFRVIPASGGTQPTDDFDVKAITANLDEDVLQGQGVDCPNDAVTRDVPLTPSGGPVYLNGETIEPLCAGMGDSNVCTLELILTDGY